MENIMMLPASYCVMNEEEMTYTTGGASAIQAIAAWVFPPYAWLAGVTAIRDYRKKNPNTPIQFLKELLPDPSTLGPRTVGKTNIGCIFTGIKDGKERSIYIYNVCDHQECYREVESQAISYTTGVPAMIGTMMVVNGLWNKPGVYTTDEFDPDPYMEALNKWGLPWKVVENPVLVD